MVQSLIMLSHGNSTASLVSEDKAVCPPPLVELPDDVDVTLWTGRPRAHHEDPMQALQHAILQRGMAARSGCVTVSCMAKYDS